MARLSKCKCCEKPLQSDEKYIHSSKAYCKQCYDKIVRDANEYKELIEFICTHYELEKPTGLILRQIKEYKTEYGWSYAAMTYTLWYCKDVLGKSFSEKFGVALIKHFYCEAEKYYTEQEQRRKQMEKLKNVEIKTKIVNRNHVKPQTNSSLLDLNSILKGGA